jgi:hypothetical protein
MAWSWPHRKTCYHYFAWRRSDYYVMGLIKTSSSIHSSFLFIVATQGSKKNSRLGSHPNELWFDQSNRNCHIGISEVTSVLLAKAKCKKCSAIVKCAVSYELRYQNTMTSEIMCSCGCSHLFLSVEKWDSEIQKLWSEVENKSWNVQRKYKKNPKKTALTDNDVTNDINMRADLFTFASSSALWYQKL